MADLTDSTVRNVFRSGEFEPDFFDIASPLISEGGVFFDVGANFGWCSFGLYGRRPGDHICYFLFEANPSVVGCLRQSARLNPEGEFHITHGCVLNRSGFSTLNFNPRYTCDGHYLGPSTDGIPNVVLDQFVADQQISTVDLLKMDIEGAEPLALEGAKVSLSKGMIKAIYIEVIAEHLKRQGRSPGDVFSVLRESGFSLFWCKPREFESFPELKRSAIKIRSNRGSFLVSPLDKFPPDTHTDILGLHRGAPLLAKVLDCCSCRASVDNEVREVLI